MRLLSASSLVFFFAVSSCWGQANDRTQPALAKVKPGQPYRAPASNPGMSKTSWQNEIIRRKLDEPANWNYDETPWNEIEEELERNYGFNIVLDDSAKEDSLTEDEPLTVNLTGLTCKSTLRIALKQKNATYIIQDGVVKIVSLDDVEDSKHFTTVFVDVRQLLTTIAEREKNRIGQPRVSSKKRAVAATPEIGKDDAAQDSRQKPKVPQLVRKPHEPVKLVTADSLLLDLVQKLFRPDQWESTGQGLATIDIIGGYAVVNCNEGFADGIRDFLTDLNYNISGN